MKSTYIHSAHNVSKLIYHFVFPTKYRRVVIDDKVYYVYGYIENNIEKVARLLCDFDNNKILDEMQKTLVAIQVSLKDISTRVDKVEEQIRGGNIGDIK